MGRYLLVALLAAGTAGCVTNISGKAAEQCAPLATNGALYSDCVATASARMEAKNRRTARVIGAGLGGAASAGQTYNAPQQQGLFFSRSYVSGMNRICIYRGPRGEEAITIGSAEICPLSR